jgi:hypothetical protein
MTARAKGRDFIDMFGTTQAHALIEGNIFDKSPSFSNL